MATLTTRLEGVERLTANLRLWQVTRRRAVADVVTEYAALIARDAKARAPVDTGALRASIEARTRGVLLTLAAEVVAGAPYAIFVEHGTSRMSAQPFLFPAFEAHSLGFYNALKDALRK